ncbi:MAG: sugar transferase [Anaerovoracaceae bacterium]|jgi:exopolysaccharide biosynthesis polyprenyl glycosylphosphotransferase
MAQNIIKRLSDIVMSLLGIVITSPIILITIIAIKYEDRGPIFFKQERCGLKGKLFNVIKFRSMVVDAEKYTGAVFATENDPRITKVGRIIRAARIDEIPQFFNVLIGNMSFVGPRPERPIFVKEFSKDFPEYQHRLAVKPGITGLAQVMGNYTTTIENKIKFDLMYIINYSMVLDIKIVMQTIKVVFKKEQAAGFSEEDSKQSN